MKAILSVILTVSLISSSVVAAPSHYKSANASVSNYTADIFGRINAHRKQQGVELSWNVSGANDISGFIIERSWDGVYFDAIDEVQVDAGTLKYQDNDVFPGYLYYRITAVMNDGTEISSPVEMVRIVKHK